MTLEELKGRLTALAGAGDEQAQTTLRHFAYTDKHVRELEAEVARLRALPTAENNDRKAENMRYVLNRVAGAVEQAYALGVCQPPAHQNRSAIEVMSAEATAAIAELNAVNPGGPVAAAAAHKE